MGRKTNEQLEKIKIKYNKSRIWSWSRYKKYRDFSYEYLLHYIRKEKPDIDGTTIYGISGNFCHGTLEDVYENRIEYKDCITQYNNNLFDMEMAELKYDRNDEEKNALIADKYENSIKHYFKNFISIPSKVAIEKFILINIGKYLFQGYIDCTFKKNGIYHILDFKTSSIYKGEKLEKEIGQLKLYALGLHQMGVPIDKIKIGYDFLKFCNITYKQKNGKIKTRTVIRRDMVVELKTPITMWLKNFKYKEKEIEQYLNKSIEANSFDMLPKEVNDKFSIDNGYMWFDVTQEIFDELIEDITKDLNELVIKELEYEKTKDDKLFWNKITDKDSYYYYTLSGYSRKLNPCWDEYLSQIEMFVDEDKKGDY